jgi:hypothetical protein
MPATASSRRLLDAFDSNEALRESASYLRELSITFGNLGLAAAAYNAGPGRLTRWISGRDRLPQETRSYVQIVTGRSISDWSGGAANWTDDGTPSDLPRPTLASPAASSDKPDKKLWDLVAVGRSALG